MTDHGMIRLREVLQRPEYRPNYLIAVKAGFAPSRLSEYALGRRPMPPHHLIALCRVMGLQPEDIADDYELELET
jgi:DNA-binding transcriptional regulator YdaS (Cro superfamily)